MRLQAKQIRIELGGNRKGIADHTGRYYEAWISDSLWHCVKVPASMCPRISKEFPAEPDMSALGGKADMPFCTANVRL